MPTGERCRFRVDGASSDGRLISPKVTADDIQRHSRYSALHLDRLTYSSGLTFRRSLRGRFRSVVIAHISWLQGFGCIHINAGHDTISIDDVFEHSSSMKGSINRRPQRNYVSQGVSRGVRLIRLNFGLNDSMPSRSSLHLHCSVLHTPAFRTRTGFHLLLRRFSRPQADPSRMGTR